MKQIVITQPPSDRWMQTPQIVFEGVVMDRTRKTGPHMLVHPKAMVAPQSRCCATGLGKVETVNVTDQRVRPLHLYADTAQLAYCENCNSPHVVIQALGNLDYYPSVHTFVAGDPMIFTVAPLTVEES